MKVEPTLVDSRGIQRSVCKNFVATHDYISPSENADRRWFELARDFERVPW